MRGGREADISGSDLLSVMEGHRSSSFDDFGLLDGATDQVHFGMAFAHDGKGREVLSEREPSSSWVQVSEYLVRDPCGRKRGVRESQRDRRGYDSGFDESGDDGVVSTFGGLRQESMDVGC